MRKTFKSGVYFLIGPSGVMSFFAHVLDHLFSEVFYELFFSLFTRSWYCGLLRNNFKSLVGLKCLYSLFRWKPQDLTLMHLFLCKILVWLTNIVCTFWWLNVDTDSGFHLAFSMQNYKSEYIVYREITHRPVHFRADLLALVPFTNRIINDLYRKVLQFITP